MTFNPVDLPFDSVQISHEILIKNEWKLLISYQEVDAWFEIDNFLNQLSTEKLDWLHHNTEFPPIVSIEITAYTNLSLWVRPEDYMVWVLKFGTEDN